MLRYILGFFIKVRDLILLIEEETEVIHSAKKELHQKYRKRPLESKEPVPEGKRDHTPSGR